ncbi:PREDICTED: intraflagellar transport protein osm-1 [Ceratosolen solmsi marchali]|uniref:Intraflagellar transport protein osm-1 n=1 Tax=Ceratosolen solmsi marchali TaxID=326594 RepID=A0AAJ6YJN5_9HYME|nr:PREDICTED: intraflagellar transport protein osm-1 [Ceratosolen solmsi marchali]
MLLKYLGSILPAHDCENRVMAIAWSPNSLKLAVASTDRSIYLFDDKGVKRDRFSTKPVDSKNGKKSYLVKGIAFSPESTKIAVGQTDNIVYVYKIGEEWGSKKVICNKFPQSSAVTCLAWPTEGPIIVGLVDGKVRAAIIKANKAQTLYAADSMTLALATNSRGTGFLSSHADGSVIRYYVSEDGTAETSGRVLMHPVSAYALSWLQSHILAAGCDKKIIFYDSRGKSVKIVDYSRSSDEKEMTVACCSPSGQSVAVGSWDKIRIFDWSPRKNIWDETNVKILTNFYTVTALAWRRDGSKLVVGSLCGAVEQFETILRRTIVRGGHEVAYVGPSQLVIRSLEGKGRPVIIKSLNGTEIEDVKILGRGDNRVVARTAVSLLICDIQQNLLSEIPWEDKNGGEKFFFEYPGVCLIFYAGELTIVEYGRNEILGTVRTESVNPHVTSVRINERQLLPGVDNKRLAYLLDSRTVRIMDLVTSATVTVIGHDARIDWLELSETGTRLLSRDKRSRLWLSDDKGGHMLLLSGASYVSWVVGSDVVVAQSGMNLVVWYNVDAPDSMNTIPVKGDVINILQEGRRTSVMVEEAGTEVAYLLNEDLIEFGTALHDNDFGRVVLFLEELGDQPHVEAMWENVATNAMNERAMIVAARSYAALGDVACSRHLKEIVQIGEKYAEETGNEPFASPDFWAKMSILKGDLKTAEAVYLEQNELSKALNMYQRYWQWEDALILAQNRRWSGLPQLRDKHLGWLMESGQMAKAASIIEAEDSRRAVKLYLKARRPGRAARLLLSQDELTDDDKLVTDVVTALKATDLMELAGEIYERIGDHHAAIVAYSQSNIYARALELARNTEPNSVVKLEKDWGNYLMSSGQYDAAINHFIEAGETSRALSAAVMALQWKKALQIIQVIEPENDPEFRSHCERVAEHFASVNELGLAEKLFLRAGLARRAVETYAAANAWQKAQELAQRELEATEARELLAGHAEMLKTAGDYRHAEILYAATEQHDEAIGMYRHAGLRQDMIRLVAKFRPELLKTTHAHLAKELVSTGKPREAEEHFLGAEDWRGAVAAYRSANMWEDALRVAEKASGDKAAQQVALMWARTLAPELGARLLSRLGHLDACLQLASEAGLFDWALEIVKYGSGEQQKDIHYRYAMALEDNGRFPEAEREFLKAGKAMEAVQMYIHTRDWQAAEDVAQNHCKDGLSQVLVAKASEAVQALDYATAESLLLRAHKPDIIIDHYKSAGMFSEAMRVCREYLPSQEAALRRELGQRAGQSDIGDGSTLIEDARRWLELGETQEALDLLLRVSSNPKPALVLAADILLHRAGAELAAQLGADLGSKLFVVNEHALAAQVFLQANRIKEAVNALAAAGDWTKAKRVVHELAPDLEIYLEDLYREAMIKEGQVENLVRVDAEAAIDMLVRKGQWGQAFETAKAQGHTVLHKYLAQRVAQLLKSDNVADALQLYSQYGAPPISQNYNLYYHLSERVLNSNETHTEYLYLAKLRNILLSLVKSLDVSAASVLKKFERILRATHYSAVYYSCRDIPHSTLADLPLKTSVSLLRYTDILLADRCYYEAGMAARNVGLSSEAFVFLNHFLDLEECVEEGDGSVLDMEDLRVTDFPLEVPLPSSLSLDRNQREEVREWVLTVSMDQRVDQGLPLDQRGVYVGSLSSHADSSTSPLPECVLTGYPVRGSSVQFDGSRGVAARDDWNKFITVARQSPSDSDLNDVLAFIQDWCGTAPSYVF